MKNLNYLIISILIFSFQTAYAQKNEVIKFTDSDTVALYSDGFEALHALDSHLQGNKVFITGENHTYTKSNARLWLKMIKYLQANAGVRNVFFEYGYAYGWLVNEYLQSGDTVLFNAIEHMAYIEYSNAIKALRAFNETLGSNERIQLFGIDVDRGVYPILKMMDYLVPDSFEAHDSIVVHLEAIKSLAYYNEVKLKEEDEDEEAYFAYKTTPTLNLVHKNFKKFEAEYQKVLGDRFELFKDLITKRYNDRLIWAQYESDRAAQQYVYRERYMFNQFMDVASKHEGKWFGQFGRCHTTQTRTVSNACDWFMFKSLAHRLDKTANTPFKDSVLSIGIAYKGEHSQGSEWEDFQNNLDDYFKSVPESSVVLLDIKNNPRLDSIFGQDFDFLFLNSNVDLGKDYEYIEEIYSESGSRGFRMRTSINFDIGQRTFDVSSINSIAENSAFLNSFEGVFDMIGASLDYTYVINGKDRLVTGIEYGEFSAQQLKTQDEDIYVSLSGDYFKFKYSYDLIAGRTFDLNLGTSLNYENLKILSTVQNAGNTNDLLSGYIGGSSVTAFNNPAFSMDLRVDAAINIKMIRVAAKVGKSFDLSSKYWRSADDNLLENGFKTSLTGTYLQAGFGLVF